MAEHEAMKCDLQMVRTEIEELYFTSKDMTARNKHLIDILKESDLHEQCESSDKKGTFPSLVIVCHQWIIDK